MTTYFFLLPGIFNYHIPLKNQLWHIKSTNRRTLKINLLKSFCIFFVKCGGHLGRHLGFWPLIAKTKNANLFFSIFWDIQDNVTMVFITKNIFLNKDILLSLLKWAFNCSLSLLAITNKRWLYCNGHFNVVKLYFFIIFLSCHCIHFFKAWLLKKIRNILFLRLF